ncbi:cell wall-binding repeat-containing protein [Agromyces sp. NPDC057679]|uniref:cell wall-binding repeat-containing protein n=1 Tax=Agromyces sp. NPDC057679 TaxID=3346207 RepID=UPI00366BD4DA
MRRPASSDTRARRAARQLTAPSAVVLALSLALPADTAAVAAADDPSAPVSSAAATGTGTITGKVTLSDGRPLDGGSVRLIRTSPSDDAYTTVAADGTYGFSGLAAGKYSLHFELGSRHAELADYVAEYWGEVYSGGDAVYFDLSAGQRRTGMNATLGLGATISGQVSLDTGAMLGAGSAQVVDPDGYSPERTVTSDANGSYTIRGVPPGRWTLQFWGRSADGEPYVTEYLGDKPYRSQATFMELAQGAVLVNKNAVLTRGATLSGRLTGPDGSPVADADVFFESAHTHSTGVRTQEASIDWITTDENGEYSIRGIPPGLWRLYFYGPPGSGLRDEWWSDRPWGNFDSIRVLPRATITGKNAKLTFESKTHPWGAVSRIAGSDRYATAVGVSASQFSAGVPVAYVASGSSFPDALAAAPVAATTGGPILLSAQNSLPRVVEGELRRLQPKRIVILGGTGAISSTVERELDEFTTGSVTRIGGADRFATSAELSKSRFAPGVPVAYLTSGSKFPDALAAAPQAAIGEAPILLTGEADSLPASIVTELKRLKPEVVHIIGGGVVGPNAHAQLDALIPGYSVVDYGTDRYATSALLAGWFDYGVSVAYVANGMDFPDALAGGPVAGIGSGPVLLTARDSLPKPVSDALKRLRPDKIVILGGTGAVSAKVEAQLDALSG